MKKFKEVRIQYKVTCSDGFSKKRDINVYIDGDTDHEVYKNSLVFIYTNDLLRGSVAKDINMTILKV